MGVFNVYHLLSFQVAGYNVKFAIRSLYSDIQQ